MNKNISTRFLAFLIGLLFAAVCQAQVPSYNIFNNSNEVLHFDTFDPGRGTWKKQVANPHQSTQYNIYSGSPTARIRIATPDHGYVEYKIGDGGIYNLKWNNRKNMWDVTATKQADYQGGANANHAQQNAAPNTRSGYGSNQQGQSSLPYSLGDAVNVLWKGKWYGATVIQTGTHKVKIHYDGYDSSWDEWVEAGRIRYR